MCQAEGFFLTQNMKYHKENIEKMGFLNKHLFHFLKNPVAQNSRLF